MLKSIYVHLIKLIDYPPYMKYIYGLCLLGLLMIGRNLLKCCTMIIELSIIPFSFINLGVIHLKAFQSTLQVCMEIL
jgi:hypothetical protein